MTSDSFCIITTTTDTQTTAEQIADTLLERKLAACIQIVPIQSRYLWRGQKESASESLLQIKTKTSLFSEIEKTIRKLHGYEVPEIIMIPVIQGSSDYLSWINEETL